MSEDKAEAHVAVVEEDSYRVFNPSSAHMLEELQ